MADHQYPCPKCAAVLRPPKAIDPGQKVKCPKCQNVFVPVPEASADDDAGTYGLVHESEAEKKQEVEIKRKSLEKVKDQRPKSKRGPAVAICTSPGNKMLAAASATCVSCIFSIVVILWPMFFSKAGVTDMGTRWMIIGVAVLAFAYNGFIAYGAVQMLSIESYRWATMAAIMNLFPLQWALSYAAFNWLVRPAHLALGELGDMIVPVFFTLIYAAVGMFAMQTLRKKEVIAGFSERKPTDL